MTLRPAIEFLREQRRPGEYAGLMLVVGPDGRAAWVTLALTAPEWALPFTDLAPRYLDPAVAQLKILLTPVENPT